jgi:phosphatidylserine decarboxylase
LRLWIKQLNSLLDRLKSWPLNVLPHHFVSRLVYRLTRIEGRLVPAVIRVFSKLYNVELNEAVHPDPGHYRSFNEFFTRELRSDARTIDSAANSIASPVDGCVSQLGRIEDGRLYQAKGINYSLLDLVGGREADASSFSNGHFATLYLSPRDYHRIHMPMSGRLTAMHYVPGRLYSVAPHTVRTVPGLFARNERVVCLFDTDAGKLAMILVGAINVAAIETVWAGLITPPNSKRIIHRDYDEHRSFNKGEEMGRFNMGSTVILLVENSKDWKAGLTEGSPVRLGDFIGEF